jgi:predicted ferric reductase
MTTIFNGSGFLGTQASLRADLSLVLIIMTAILFTIGWRLAVNKKYVAHQTIQNLAVGLNVLVVLLTMTGIFINSYLPAIPVALNNPAVALVAVHAATGTLGLLYGVYVSLAADKLLPERLQYKKFKPVMRVSYLIYVLLTLGGTAIYLRLYM